MYEISTVGESKNIKLTLITDKSGFKADGADLALIEVEVVDSNGKRAPLDNTLINFELEGPAEWRGGTAQGPGNYILSKSLPVECGVNRILVRSTPKAGKIKRTAKADGFKDAKIDWKSKKIETSNGLSEYFAADELHSILDRGETPATASYTDEKIT